MTDDELKAVADKLRLRAQPAGTMHPAWDLIFDIEALLAGNETLVSREQIIEMAERHRA